MLQIGVQLYPLQFAQFNFCAIHNGSKAVEDSMGEVTIFDIALTK